ncbi:plasmid stablization protein ParB [Oceanicola sp. 22II-s10i]|uniref:plasmid partitioning protein RepB n=1 Tax=Oceanicola sp. 22II-s10i TaxID=1317116 RepID=UPI000B524D81|nr:plasmid partitioning protein RepB [Oceanicola sp. 22II-s10i]OWU83172.1 plasmid stablization protein ParB [Oceanicola sp. 22II-s10i]
MARKNLLSGLMEGQDAPRKEAEAPAPRPTYTKGAIGAVSQSIAQLKSRAMVEVHADMIDDAGFKDRLGEDPEDFERLKDSLATYGQQVPVLLRFDPNTEGRYQVVYGRRRVAALKALKQPVKAMIRDINDRDLIVAQGQENSQRRDLTFIEKANFARQMVEASFERKVVCDALNIDKTLISRMLAVAEAVPVKLMRAIGPAPSAGRDRWMKLAEHMPQFTDLVPEIARGLDADTSDARFEQAFAIITAKPAAPPAPKKQPRELKAGDTVVARAKKAGKRTTLTFDADESGGFEDWLIENIAEIHRDWKKARGE